MNYLVIGIIVLSIAIFILGSFLLYYQVVTIESMKKDFRKMYRELGMDLGFDESDWSSNFSETRTIAIRNKKLIEEINELPLIIKAKEVKRLEELERTKVNAEREINKLTRNGG